MKIVTFALLCLLFGTVEIRGQDAPKDLTTLAILPQPLPSGDLIGQAPDPAKWTVTSIAVTNAPVAAPSIPAAPKATVYTFTKSGKTYLVESVSADGKKIVRWKDHQFQATYLSGAAQPLVDFTPTFLPDGSVLYYMDFSKSDFPEFSWINARNYVGMTKLGADTMGLVFKAKVSTKGLQMSVLTMPHDRREDAIAVTDAKTHQPLMLQVGGELLLYHVTDGEAEVNIPPEVQAVFNSFRKQIRQAAAIPPG